MKGRTKVCAILAIFFHGMISHVSFASNYPNGFFFSLVNDDESNINQVPTIRDSFHTEPHAPSGEDHKLHYNYNISFTQNLNLNNTNNGSTQPPAGRPLNNSAILNPDSYYSNSNSNSYFENSRNVGDITESLSNQLNNITRLLCEETPVSGTSLRYCNRSICLPYFNNPIKESLNHASNFFSYISEALQEQDYHKEISSKIIQNLTILSGKLEKLPEPFGFKEFLQQGLAIINFMISSKEDLGQHLWNHAMARLTQSYCTEIAKATIELPLQVLRDLQKTASSEYKIYQKQILAINRFRDNLVFNCALVSDNTEKLKELMTRFIKKFDISEETSSLYLFEDSKQFTDIKKILYEMGCNFT